MKSWTLINKLKNLSKKLMILKKRLEISNENDHLGLVISKNHKSFMFFNHDIWNINYHIYLSL